MTANVNNPGQKMSWLSKIKAGSGKANQTYQFKLIETPKNIWDKSDLEDILSRDDIDDFFDEEFRRKAELASKTKHKSCESVNMTIINTFLEDCKYLELIKLTIEHKLGSDLIDTAAQAAEASEMFIAEVRDERFIFILFAGYLEQWFPSITEPLSPTLSHSS